MADGAATDVGLGHFLHVDGALHAAEDAVALEGVLQRQRVHDRGQHADVVRLGAVHAIGCAGDAAEDVAAAHHDGKLHAVMHHVGDLVGQGIDHLRIDAVAKVACQRLAGQLQQHALISVFLGHIQPPG